MLLVHIVYLSSYLYLCLRLYLYLRSFTVLHLQDVSPLTVPFGKSGVKKEDVLERCRARLVAALKTGAVFALYLGDVRIEHADFKNKLCKKVTYSFNHHTT